jgi:hypothetical protein
MQGAGEKQKTEHPLEQSVIEIGQLQNRLHSVGETESGDEAVEQDRAQGGEERDDDQADGLRQPQQVVVEVAKKGRQHDDDGGQVE